MNTIIFDYRLNDSGGLGRFITSLLPYFKDQFTIYLIIKKGQPLPNLPFQYQVILFTSSVLTFSEQLEFIFKLPAADLLFIPSFNVPLFFGLVKPKKLVAAIHDTYHIDFPDHKSLFVRLFYYIFLFAATTQSSHLLTVSYFSMRRLLMHFPSIGPISIISNASSVGNLPVSTTEVFSDSLLNEFIESGSKPILFVGNLKIHKNLVQLLEFLRKYPARRALIVGTSVGRSTVESDLKRFSASFLLQERIFFAGKVVENDLKLCYLKAQCLVFPSIYEGFGIPIVEAQSLGLPVLCSDIPVCKEIGGQACIYFQPNADGIFRALTLLESMSSEEKGQLINRGLDNARQYNWSFSAKLLKDIFKIYLPR